MSDSHWGPWARCLCRWVVGGGMGAASGVLIPGHGPALSPQLSCAQSKCRNLERGAGSWDTFTLGLPQAQQNLNLAISQLFCDLGQSLCPVSSHRECRESPPFLRDIMGGCEARRVSVRVGGAPQPDPVVTFSGGTGLLLCR